jgi:hypothetical protein
MPTIQGMAQLRFASFSPCLASSLIVIGFAIYGIYVSDSYHSFSYSAASAVMTKSHQSIWEYEPLVAIRTTIGYLLFSGSPALIAFMNMRRPTFTKLVSLWVMAILNTALFTIAFLGAAPFIAPALLFVVGALLATAASKAGTREPFIA